MNTHVQALDYEEIKALNLQVVVSNKAKYNFGSTTATGPTAPRPYPVKINVVNQKEGPRFHPTVKVVTISEDHSSVSLHKVITNYAAIDSDTSLTATNVRYGTHGVSRWRKQHFSPLVCKETCQELIPELFD